MREVIALAREEQEARAKEIASTTHVITEAREKQEAFLDHQIASLSATRSHLGSTSSPGPVVNATTLSGLLIASLAVAGVMLTEEQVGAIEVILAALVPVAINLVAGYQARRQVTPVR